MSFHQDEIIIEERIVEFLKHRVIAENIQKTVRDIKARNDLDRSSIRSLHYLSSNLSSSSSSSSMSYSSSSSSLSSHTSSTSSASNSNSATHALFSSPEPFDNPAILENFIQDTHLNTTRSFIYPEFNKLSRPHHINTTDDDIPDLNSLSDGHYLKLRSRQNKTWSRKL